MAWKKFNRNGSHHLRWSLSTFETFSVKSVMHQSWHLEVKSIYQHAVDTKPVCYYDGSMSWSSNYLVNKTFGINVFFHVWRPSQKYLRFAAIHLFSGATVLLNARVGKKKKNISNITSKRWRIGDDLQRWYNILNSLTEIICQWICH